MDLHYVSTGSGPVTILALHGGLGSDLSSLRPWLDPLSEQATVVYYDHRGNGRSPRSPSDSSADMDVWVEDADAVRRHLGLERVVLLGHSFGGCIAQEYALRYPDRLDGLILCSTAPAYDHLEVVVANVRDRGTPEQAAAFEAGFAAPPASDDAMREGFGVILPLYFHAPDAPHQRQAIRALVDETAFSAASYVASAAALTTFDTRDRLGGITAPTLVLNGDDDFLTPTDHAARRLHAAIPDSELAVLDRSGHFPHIEAHDAFIASVQDWLGRRVLNDATGA